MNPEPRTPDYWPAATRTLSRRDPVMKGIIRAYRGETLTSRGDAFYTLARSITGQQISVKAADTIGARLEQALGPLTPACVLATDSETLRACGLSGAKVAYIQSIAEYFRHRPQRHWHLLDDEALIKELSTLKGVGRWTAEMFLIFYLMRPDVLPLDDIGLIKGVSRHYNAGERLGRNEVEAIAERWRPWRTVATWYLWRALDPAVVAY